MNKYVNFFLKTSYSILESSIKIDDLIDFAEKNQIKTLAIANTNVLFGAIEFYDKCVKKGIKPIIGLDIQFKEYRLLLYAKNYEGYKYLLLLSSQFNEKKPVILNSTHAINNLIVINHPKNHEKPVIKGVDIVSSSILSETLYLYPENWESIKLLNFIKNKNNNKKILKKLFYPLKPLLNQNMEINNKLINKTIKIANECNLILKKQSFSLPTIINKNLTTEYSYLKKICLNNLEKKQIKKKLISKYLKRLNYELSILKEMKFINYFLIIYDFVQWATEKKIIIGPGRGSAPSSLVSYLLNITQIDPIKYNLLFERFLNTERISAPDIDIDVEDNRRMEIINYIFEKYKDNTVAQIITFQKFGPKMAFRDAAKYLGIPLYEVNDVATSLSKFKTLKNAYKNSSLFRSFINKDNQIKAAYILAQKIEGSPRQIGTHAAGIVISKNPISENVPTIEIDGILHTQYAMNYLENNGLIKIDILGLKNLSIIKLIQNSIFSKFRKRINLNKIPLNIKDVNKIFTTGNTNGIFQFESRGMRKALREIEIDNFNDLVAVNALYRPGPMEYIPVYAKRKKQKEKFFFASNVLEKILNSTYGIVVYQEQIMLIAQKFAGLSFSKADILRKAISKKKITEINALKKEFYDGALKAGFELKIINEVYEYILKFSNYGFNKAHAVSYSTIAYWLAFFKARFPVHFFNSLLNTSSEVPYLFKSYIHEMRKYNINLVEPAINMAKEDFFIIDNNNIVAPFRIIKGIGHAIYTKIISERKSGQKFLSFPNFVARMKKHNISNSVISNLIKGNCLKEFGNKKTLLMNLKQTLRYAEIIKLNKNNVTTLNFNLINEPNLEIMEKDFFIESKYEYEVYENFLFSHPTENFSLENVNKIIDIRTNRMLTVIGIIRNVKTIKTKKGDKMAFIFLEDKTYGIEVVIFPDIFSEISQHLIKNNIIKCLVSFQTRNNEESFILKRWIELKGKYER